MMEADIITAPGSFRDPSGHVFFRDGVLLRQVNHIYKDEYEHFIGSGLYKTLVDEGLLVSHKDGGRANAASEDAYKIIMPEKIPFISYPYEWCFSQLKAAALATLKIQKIAFKHGMSLKDCSAYNVQFRQARPVLIDSLSFERYREGRPWVAYRQFCQHFLAPLALMSTLDVRLNQLLRNHIDGIPPDMASALLPLSTYLNFGIFSHIHLHARSQRFFAAKNANVSGYKMNRFGVPAIVGSLESIIHSFEWKAVDTAWASYYENNCYSEDALAHKKELVTEFVGRINPSVAWDIGANTGVFSRIAANKGALTISIDSDPGSVERNYLTCADDGETKILPLLIDFINPSPGTGWLNKERLSIFDRGPADAALALALIHHLAISNNLPFSEIALFFKSICKALIIEFVPKDDIQAKRLLSSRDDIFYEYKQGSFERAFGAFFSIEERKEIRNSGRILYLMRRN